VIFLFEEYPDILTVQDVQRALQIGRSKVYRMISDGTIKYIKVGSSLRIPKSFLLEHIKKDWGA
jgi:DNA binding domain, excisionase family